MIIGLTGGIGSGKSAVSDCFEKFGVTVVDADIVAREVVEPGTAALRSIAEHFGDDILTSQGALDRAALRTLIFSDESQRKWLEALLHPLIRNEITQQLSQSSSPYSILSSPLLLETDQASLADRILVVDVPVELQIERTVQRDSNSIDQVKAIINAQSSRELKQQKADDIILNIGTIEELEKDVSALHRRYLQMV
ncbi:dephospho-CoA kinase [Alkalimarinus sediminis]|uniref:Dephospho-CoA kinase n=1 Tax=Alkalimarinus sediminis TaxID=1632866 RepID=A0A9E8HF21_9ALTE|nr:dephospho-CoA kinase [Alkalimarinus sediminis]UZW73453.1 dephospho-CoA kinase [Alkalimarinus sediminis]